MNKQGLLLKQIYSDHLCSTFAKNKTKQKKKKNSEKGKCIRVLQRNRICIFWNLYVEFAYMITKVSRSEVDKLEIQESQRYSSSLSPKA